MGAAFFIGHTMENETHEKRGPGRPPKVVEEAAARVDETVKMEIVRDCFVSEASVVMRDGKRQERLKVFKGETHDLHADDAKLLDKHGLAKKVW